MALARKMFAGQIPHYRIAKRYIKKNGDICWINLSASVISDARGAALYGLAMFEDITEQRAIEQNLRASEERFRTFAEMEAEQTARQAETILEALFDNAPLPMLISEGKTEKVLNVNRRFKEIIGYSLSDIPDVAHWWPLAYPDRSYRRKIKNLWTRRMIQAMREQKTLLPVEAEITCKNGEQRVFECHATSIGQQHLVVFVDLTEIRRLEEQLREAETRFRSAFQQEREQLINDLREAIANAKTLQGLLPICSSCKKIRDDKGYWKQIESYISTHTDILFSHSVCPACAKKLYSELEELLDTEDDPSPHPD